MTLPPQLSQTAPPFWGLGGLVGEYRGSDDSVCLAVRWRLDPLLPGVFNNNMGNGA